MISRRGFLKTSAGTIGYLSVPSFAYSQESLPQSLARLIFETKKGEGITNYHSERSALDVLALAGIKIVDGRPVESKDPPPQSYTEISVQVNNPTIAADIKLRLYYADAQENKINYADKKNRLIISDLVGDNMSQGNVGKVSGISSSVGGAFVDDGLDGILDNATLPQEQEAYTNAIRRLNNFYQKLKK